MIQLAIFDFDGTLVDTITDVALSFAAALTECGFPPRTEEEVVRLVGGDLEAIVSKLLPPEAVTRQNVDRVKAAYRSIYLASDKPNTRPYPGVMELLAELRGRGMRLAVNSNKGQALLDDMAARMFPPKTFDAVVGYLESRPSKPDPYGVDLICGQCGCGRADAVYIGDGRSDIATAHNAGIPCLFVHWGQGTAQDRADPRIAAHIADISQLREILLTQELPLS